MNDTGNTGLCMELCHGDAKAFLEAKGQLPDLELAMFLSQVTTGVAFLHKEGLLHRDLKLLNVLIQTKAPFGGKNHTIM